jgi:RimJ/RimL family protein N-acetyltransferase
MIAEYNGKKYILKGKKVVLDKVTKKHLPLFVKWLNDKEVIRFLENISGSTLKKEIKWFENAKKSKKDITFGIYALDNKKKVFIGSTSLRNIDTKHRKAVWGILIGDKNYWGKGIGTETTRLMLEFGFKKLKLNSISLSVDTNNKAGQKAYKRAGFKVAGKLRKDRKFEGKFHDSIIMDILSSEFKSK